MIEKLVNYIKDNDLKINYVNDNLDVVNIDSLLEIKDDVIRIKKDNRIISVYGSNLTINKLLDNEILIMGNISKIEM